jgi:putative transposase
MKPKRSQAKPKRYPSDLTRTQWERLRPLLPDAKPGGRPREVARREVVNGILSICRGGCGWRMMPKDLPPWSPCYDDFRTGRIGGIWSKVNATWRAQVRHKEGRQEGPSMGIIASQSVQTTEPGGPRGKDAHKTVSGRKRHLVVDTLGMVVSAVVHSAGLPDRDGAKPVLGPMVPRFPRRKKILADGISNGGVAEWAREVGGWIFELVARPRDEDEEERRKFKPLKWRWIVERTFAWLGRYRRLSKDYEGTEASSESWICIAMTHLMLRRLESA